MEAEVKKCKLHIDGKDEWGWCVIYDGKIYPFLEEEVAKYAAASGKIKDYMSDGAWEVVS